MAKIYEHFAAVRVTDADGTLHSVRFPIAPYPAELEPPVLEKRGKLEGSVRSYIRLTVRSTAEEVRKQFCDGCTWRLEYDWFNDTHGVPPTEEQPPEGVLPDTETARGTDLYDKTEFCRAGDVTDHRDGRITFYMLKKTAEELENEALEAENARLLFENLTGTAYAQS